MIGLSWATSREEEGGVSDVKITLKLNPQMILI